MGRDESASGVLHGGDVGQAVPKVEGVAPVATRRRRYCAFPWEVDHRRSPVAHELRTYTFDWTDGGIAVLPEEWHHKRDEEGHVVQSKKNPIADANHMGFPELTYQEVRQIQLISAKQEVPLNIALMKVIDKSRLTAQDIENISASPDMYAGPLREDVVAADRATKIKDFNKRLAAIK